MSRRRLPIGKQTFRKLREQDCYYVDKTHFIERATGEAEGPAGGALSRT